MINATSVSQTVIGTALLLSLVITRLPALAASSATTWTQLIYLALFCSVVAFLAQILAIQGTSASRAGL